MINRSNIRIIIGLMIIALTGLIGIQIYWISNAISLEQQRFESSVNTVLNNVVEMVEKQEVAQNVRKRFDVSRQGKTFFLGIDSLIRKNINRKDTTTSGLVFWNEISPGELQTEFRQLTEDGSIEVIEETRRDSNGAVEFHKIRRAKQNDRQSPITDVGSNYQGKQQQTDPRLERLMKKSGLVTDVFKELFNLNIHSGVEDRIDPHLVDSLLKVEFQAVGITTPFEFGMYDFINNKLFVDHPTDYTQELMKTRFRMRLFPHDIFYHPDYLMLYFPEQDSYVFNNLKVMFGTSAFFIIIIIASFSYTIGTVIRQKKLSDIKSDFINNMTHELKTPISTISLACEALGDPDVNRSAKMAENYTRMISEENKRLAQLVENVLQSAMLEKSDFQLQLTSVHMHQLIETVVSSMKMQLDRKKVVIHLNLKAENSVIVGDLVHLRNIIANLLDNAMKYTPDSPEITIETRNKSEQLCVSVTDNGIGIARDQQKLVFEKMYRVPTGNIHNVKGFGLGLSYVKSIVEKHKGTVSITSTLGIGTTFTICLPYFQEKS